ncbi:hypothetical protein BJ322DRAFT_1081988 [Thelephora terrestris]|uniref:Uncharacterized protein n=1 Tax=Thelephora terrestris TaxID=56493 RepID=A0A9P6H8L4_9AGAM|nr:hypothetical protein BJ322DRAFT_1081988 [Thelephora terrestris]
MTPPRFTPWTPEEDKLLIDAVAACGAKICWKHVAKSMSGRDNKACRKRWIHSLDPKLRKGRWSTSEDAALLEAVNKHGKRWYEVAKDLPGRTDDQCAKRYKEAVDPSIRRDPWSKEEDDQLWEVFQQLGNKWHAISSTLQGRPAVHCRNRLQSLQRLRAASASSEEREVTPSERTSESPLDSSLLNFSTPSETTSPSPVFTFAECDRSPSTSSLSSWHPSTPSDASPSNRVMVVEALPSASYPSAPVERIACSTDVGETHHHPSQNFSFPATGCVSGLFENDSRMFGFEADPIQTGFWTEIPSQQPWSSAGPPTQIVTSPSIQDDSDRNPSTVDAHGNGILSCSGIPEPLNVVPNISDAMTGAAFTMTCPIPHCYFQCQTVVDMWKHLTWTHVRPNSKESGIEDIVERVVLSGSS